MSAASWMGFAIGVAAGLTAGLLAAPMRGSDMRSTLRSRASDGSQRLQSLAASGRGWAQNTMDRAMTVMEEGRRAFRTSRQAGSVEPAGLTATLGEIAEMHEPMSTEVRL
jgi:gas vesicle protein